MSKTDYPSYAERLDRAIIKYGAMSRLAGTYGSPERHQNACEARTDLTRLIQIAVPDYNPEKWAREADGFVDNAKTLGLEDEE